MRRVEVHPADVEPDAKPFVEPEQIAEPLPLGRRVAGAEIREAHRARYLHTQDAIDDFWESPSNGTPQLVSVPSPGWAVLPSMQDPLRCSATLAASLLAIVLGIRALNDRSLSQVSDNSARGLDAATHRTAANDPTRFTSKELSELQARFGVHGPQNGLAQIMTIGVDQFQPLRDNTLLRLRELKPVVLREANKRRVNPMLLTAILFDEIQHSKPGEQWPLITDSGLVKTFGPAQLGISELVHQKYLPQHPTSHERRWARRKLLDPNFNVQILAGKIQRLKGVLGLPMHRALDTSQSLDDAKAIATLAYLHNGKLDYPARVMRYMQDPELHGLIYSTDRDRLTVLV